MKVRINEFENYTQITIPTYYKIFIKNYNPNGLEIMFHGFYGLKELREQYDEIGNIENIYKNGFLPIIGDGSGNYYCIKGERKSDILC